MFCYQCEQTAKGTGCTGKAGVCGKTAQISDLQDQLIGALIGIARTARNAVLHTGCAAFIEAALFATITNVNFDEQALEAMLKEAAQHKAWLAPNCMDCASPCSKNEDYSPHNWFVGDEDIGSLKSLILFGLKGMAAYAHHARNLGFVSQELDAFFIKALDMLGQSLPQSDLLALCMEVGEKNLLCMQLLDTANTKTYGTPAPTVVSQQVKAGAFIVISGHDLHDLHALLEQTKDKGIGVYTHGEMLPAHAYPELKKYPHLLGNFGTAWQNQQKEFDNIPAPILFTTNCLMPPKDSYADRVFTTHSVGFTGITHIADQDFSPVIAKALELGGYKKDTLIAGANGGTQVTTGFGHATVLSIADKLLEAVSTQKLRHIFLVGGCDGARNSRSYYTNFVKHTPQDTMILTLACGKYRFNDLSLGDINGIPRLVDMGQCNDAYSAIRVADALAKKLGCGLNDLPLSLVLSWYEQKAVAVLLTLLHLGMKNILIGPSLPAFLSKNVLDLLVKEYGLTPIGDFKADIQACLSKK